MSVVFNPPPQWRTYLPANFVPEAGWTPPATWASIPARWALWIDSETGLPADAPEEYRGNKALNLLNPLPPATPTVTDDEVSNTRGDSSATGSTIHENVPGLSPAQGTSTTSRSRSKFLYGSIALAALVAAATVTYFIFGSQEAVTTSGSKEPSSISSAQGQPSPATSLGASNALREANDLLSMNGLSAEGLKEQLNYNGYTSEESQYALDNITADWNEHAVRAANQALDDNGLSRSGLADSLKYSGFTEQQINHALDNITADWNKHAVKAANQALDDNGLSRSGLADTLKYSGFTEQQINHALDNITADWDENARRAAKEALEQSPYSKQQLIDYLELSGFSRKQAEDGVKATEL